ncbi:unnamed protein product, partial [Prorocentrum cordatum]
RGGRGALRGAQGVEEAPAVGAARRACLVEVPRGGPGPVAGGHHGGLPQVRVQALRHERAGVVAAVRPPRRPRVDGEAQEGHARQADQGRSALGGFAKAAVGAPAARGGVARARGCRRRGRAAPRRRPRGGAHGGWRPLGAVLAGAAGAAG